MELGNKLSNLLLEAMECRKRGDERGFTANLLEYAILLRRQDLTAYMPGLDRQIESLTIELRTFQLLEGNPFERFIDSPDAELGKQIILMIEEHLYDYFKLEQSVRDAIFNRLWEARRQCLNAMMSSPSSLAEILWQYNVLVQNTIKAR